MPAQLRPAWYQGEAQLRPSFGFEPDVPPTAPETAPVVSLVSRTHLAVTFSFTPVEGATGYEWRQGSGAWVDLGDVVEPVTVEGLTPDTGYTFEVRAYNTVGFGPAGSLGTSTLPDPAAPPNTAPFLVVSAVTHLQATITITTPANLATAHEWRLVGSGEWNDINGATQFNVTGLDPQTGYTVQVRGWNSDGAGPSSFASFTTEPTPLFPPTTAPVLGLVATLYEAVILGFLDVATGAHGHEYRVDDGPWADLDGDTGDFTVGTLLPGRTYTVSVRGYNGDGVGPEGSIQVTTLAYPQAHAGRSRYVLRGATVMLNGSNSTGLDIAYSWVQTSGAGVTLAGAGTATPSFTAPAEDATLVFTLTVTDANEFTDDDTVTVKVVETLPDDRLVRRRWPIFTHTGNF